MRLLTHNMLSSTIKGVTNGFPLKIEPQKIIERPVEFNPIFLKNMFAKLEWKPLVEASKTMGYFELPEDVSDLSVLESDEFLHKFHHALLEIHLEEGVLVCPETGRKFPVQKGIPNMMLHEDENNLRLQDDVHGASSFPKALDDIKYSKLCNPSGTVVHFYMSIASP
ncbi:Multifunctional methyltransferase subunit TRM112-like protein [Heracleum sosnowskyi]|uniref:Multifunctional methyltransferase subunit TRM112-like protein n=1 Tax=Heracleum sosnowskyi TaxID=360622 RepID=A0AAD8N004_9APIA|nr:Multifunctional methyltransferase subunit TRM112-like protein [Heracleum sosnowskyi]